MNVEYAPTIPTLRPMKQQRELTCKTDANPEPTFMWVLPDGSQRSGHTIELMVSISYSELFCSYNRLATFESKRYISMYCSKQVGK